MKKYFVRYYNFIRNTSLILVVILSGSVFYLTRHPAQEQRVMATMGYESISYEALDNKKSVFGVASISSGDLGRDKRIVLDVPRGKGYVQLSDIHFVTMDDGKPVIVLKSNDSLPINLTLAQLYDQLDKLSPEYFFKTKSEIFSIAQILSVTSESTKYKKSSSTQYCVTLKGGVSFPISTPRFRELKGRLESL